MRRSILILAICLTALTAHRAPAQESSPDLESESVMAQLERLNHNLERIADAMTTQTKLELLVRRVEVSSLKVTETEKRLRELSDEREALEAERAEMDARLQTIRERIDTGSIDVSANQIGAAISRMEREIQHTEDRIDRLTSRASILEATLSQERDELADWQDYLDGLITDL